MMRAAKGSSYARNIPARVKISQDEKDALTLLAGSVGMGLRTLIDLHMTPTMRREVTPPAPTENTENKPHRHKRSTIVDTQWDAGFKVEVWACECGEVLK